MDRIEAKGRSGTARFLGNTAHRLGDQNPSDQDADANGAAPFNHGHGWSRPNRQA